MYYTKIWIWAEANYPVLSQAIPATSSSLQNNMLLFQFSPIVFSTTAPQPAFRSIQSHYREVTRWEIFMEQELRFGLDFSRMANFAAFIASKSFDL